MRQEEQIIKKKRGYEKVIRKEKHIGRKWKKTTMNRQKQPRGRLI